MTLHRHLDQRLRLQFLRILEALDTRPAGLILPRAAQVFATCLRAYAAEVTKQRLTAPGGRDR